MIKNAPYPFDKIFCIASDCDCMEPDFYEHYKEIVNTKYGIPIFNSFWVTSDDSNLGIFNYNGAMNKNKNLIIKDFHNGFLDHLHDWSSGNLRLSIFDKKMLTLVDSLPDNSQNTINIDSLNKRNVVNFKFVREYFQNYNLPKHIYYFSNDYNILKERIPRINKKVLNIKYEELINTSKIKYQINDNHILIENQYENFDNNYINKSIINLYVSKDSSIIKNILVRSDTSTEISKCIYYTDCIFYKIFQFSIEKPLHYLENRLISIDVSKNVEVEMITLDNSSNLNNKLSDIFLDSLNININYMSQHGGWTHNDSFATESLLARSDKIALYDLKSVNYVSGIPSIMSDNCRNILYNFDKDYFELNDNEKENNFVIKHNLQNITSGGCNLPLLIMRGLSEEKDNFWYTHFGTLFYDIGKKEYPKEYEYYIEKLMKNYYNINNTNNRRLFVCSPAFYTKYKIVKKELINNLIVDKDIYINKWISEKNSIEFINENSWSSDLSFMTLYTDNEESKLFINNKEEYNYIRNPKDTNGKCSITILDITNKTYILSELPYDISEIKNCIIQNQDTFGKKNMILKSQGISFLKIKLDETYNYNTSHIFIDIESKFKNLDTEFNIIFNVGGKKIGLVYKKIISDLDSYWELDSLNTSRHSKYFAVYNLKFNNISNNIPIPNGKIESLEIIVNNGSENDYIKIKELSFFSPNPNFKHTEEYLVGGYVIINGKKTVSRNIKLICQDNSIQDKDTGEDGFYFFRLKKQMVYKLEYILDGHLHKLNWRINSRNNLNNNFYINY